MALHRAGDVADDDERARLLDRPAPDPRHELAAGARGCAGTSPAGRAGGRASGARSDGSAAAPAAGSARRRGARRRAARRASSGRTRGGAASRRASRRRARRRRPRCRRRPRQSSSPAVGIGMPRSSGPRSSALVARQSARPRPVGSSPSELGRSAGRWSGGAWKSPWRRRPLAPPAIEDGVVGLAVVAPPDEDGLAGGSDLLALADVDQRQRPREVDRGAEVDVEPGGPQRPSEADRLVQQASTVDLGAPRGLDDSGIVRQPACGDSATNTDGRAMPRRQRRSGVRRGRARRPERSRRPSVDDLGTSRYSTARRRRRR